MDKFANDQELEFSESELRKAYLAACQDEGQQEAISEWENANLKE